MQETTAIQIVLEWLYVKILRLDTSNAWDVLGLAKSLGIIHLQRATADWIVSNLNSFNRSIQDWVKFGLILIQTKLHDQMRIMLEFIHSSNEVLMFCQQMGIEAPKASFLDYVFISQMYVSAGISR